MLWWTIQNLLIAGLVAALVRVACHGRRIGPVGRHALWLVVLVKLLTPPLIVWPWAVHNPLANPNLRQTPVVHASSPSSLPRDEIFIPDDADPPPDFIIGDGIVQASPAPRPHVSAPPIPAIPFWQRFSGYILPLAAAVWIAGAAIFALLQCIRILRMASHLRRARPAGVALVRRIEEAAARLGVRSLQTRIVPGIASPMVWCLRRPTLLWPAQLPSGISDDALHGLIVHELAHVKRRDHWVGWLELFAGCLWWWNPLFWYVRHQLRENAELACDAWVVDAMPRGAGRSDRRAYAEALLAVCEFISTRHPAAPIPAVGINTGGRRFLERRLAMILRERVPLRLPRVGLIVVALLALCTLPAWSQKGPDKGSSSPPGNLEISVEQDAQFGEEFDIEQGIGIGDVGLADPRGGGGTQALQRLPGVGRLFVTTEAGGLGGPAGSLPPEGQKLLQQQQAEDAAARREFEQAQAARRERLIGQLRELQDRLTKDGKLDEAVAVRDYLRAIQPDRDGGGAVRTLTRTSRIRAIADPGNLVNYRDQVGKSFYVDVTGSTDGTVWGGDNGVYTDDSTLAAAAVHAGILQPRQRGIVHVTIVGPRDAYHGSTRNGVTTSDYGPWEGSYRIAAGPANRNLLNYRTAPAAQPDPGNLQGFRDRIGQSFSFQVTGSTDAGTIWGGANGEYTDDSPLATAAVHAGLLEPGKPGIVRVTILPGQDSYTGSTAHGVTSQSYGNYGGTYRFDRDARLLWERRSAVDFTPYEEVLRTYGAQLGWLKKTNRDARLGGGGGTDGAYNTSVTGTTDGTVWGTDVYTDDSTLGAAAVHAGLLKDGERATLRIVPLPGRDHYDSSTRNGVTSQPWGQWGGSIRLEHAAAGSPPGTGAPPAPKPSPGGE
jgi:beta-lactamase regulating signal transducer with metallopeptidase domain